MAWTPFCFASLRMLNSNRCGFNQFELSGLSGSPSVSSFSSGECGNAILQYCYGFNRLGLAQGLLQSVPSLQVSVAMLYYSIVMVSIGSLSTGSPSVSTFSSGECGNIEIVLMTSQPY